MVFNFDKISQITASSKLNQSLLGQGHDPMIKCPYLVNELLT